MTGNVVIATAVITPPMEETFRSSVSIYGLRRYDTRPTTRMGIIIPVMAMIQCFFPAFWTTPKSILTPMTKRKKQKPIMPIFCVTNLVFSGITFFANVSLCPSTDGPKIMPAYTHQITPNHITLIIRSHLVYINKLMHQRN